MRTEKQDKRLKLTDGQVMLQMDGPNQTRDANFKLSVGGVLKCGRNLHGNRKSFR